MDNLLTFFNFLLEPLQYEFMLQAMIITTSVAIPMAMLSCFLVLKGWSLMGDAISHAVLPGIVIAYIINIPLTIGAFIAGMFCAISTGFLQNNSRVKEDTIMGIVFSGMFAFGLILFIKVNSSIHLDHILFGDMLGINWTDITQSGLIAALCFVFILAKQKALVIQTFDEQHAKAIGINTKWHDYLLLTALSLMIVASLTSIGLILSIAFLITPGAIAFLISKRFTTMMILAIIIASLSSLLGIYLSFFLDSAPAPTIVLLMTVVFIVVFFAQTRSYNKKLHSV